MTGESYLQRWSALSSKGVSFSRNSKAQLTSSVKSCEEPGAAMWLLGPLLHPQLVTRAHEDTPLHIKPDEPVTGTTGLQ